MSLIERIRYAISFNRTDRISIYNNGNVSGMHEVAYRNLLKYLDIEYRIKIYDPVQRLAEVKNKIKGLLGDDTRYIYLNTSADYKFLEI